MYKEVSPEQAPMHLLLEADPSKQCILEYLEGAWCFVACEQEAILGVCVMQEKEPDRAELFNIAVDPTRQEQGIGSGLLRYVLSCMKDRQVRWVELGTGTFGYQLTFYQRHGFRVKGVIPDFFVDRYPQPVFENGLQHRDMLRLVCDLGDSAAQGAGERV